MKKWISKIALGICLLVFGLGPCVFAAEDTILGRCCDRGSGRIGHDKSSGDGCACVLCGGCKRADNHLKIGDNTLEAPLSEFGVTCTYEDAVDEALGIGRTGHILKRYKEQKDLQHGRKSLSVGMDGKRVYGSHLCRGELYTV